MTPQVRILVFLLLLAYTSPRNLGDNAGETFFKLCPPTRCGSNKKGPTVRFPFRLNTQPTFCGQGGYELSCSGNNTIIHLSISSDFYVKDISYVDRKISLMEVHNATCPLQSLMSLNISGSIIDTYYKTFSLVKCTKIDATNGLIGPIDCLRDDSNLVYATDGDASMDKLPSTCSTFKSGLLLSDTNDLRQTIERLLRTKEIIASWRTLSGCYGCRERSGNYCGFNSTSKETLCYNPKHKSSRGPIIIGTSVGSTILLAFMIFFVYILRKSSDEKETLLKIEKFLANYRTHNPSRYTFTEIKKITNRFTDKIGKGGYGSVYRGKLPNGIPVAVKMLENSTGNGEQFINEVATISRIHHFNVVRLLGFCYEGPRRALIYEFMPNGSLERFLFLKDTKSSHTPLSWEKLQQIAIGIAHGIEYLHQGCNQRILHFDIKPQNILLDHNFHPKISDFGLAKLCSKDQSVVSMTAARGTTGYIAPELFSRTFGEVSYKSDVYSYGMLLLEIVGCRKNIDFSVENQSQIYFPEWIYNRMSQGKELPIQVEKDGDEEMAKKLAIVALRCIQWSPKDRPSMTMVVQMLESDLQSLEIPPKPFVSSDVEMGST